MPYLMIWWQSQYPYAVVIENKVAMEAAAGVRNALVVEYTGKIDAVLDWWRRNDKGEPLPVEWRDITPRGPMGTPAMVPRRASADDDTVMV